MNRTPPFLACLLIALSGSSYLSAAETWSIHDMQRPWPERVEPKSPADLAPASRPPANAQVLFDGTDLSRWRPSQWQVADGYVEITPKSGSLVSLDTFGSCHLHLEWQTPDPPKGHGQNRANSGVFLMNRYEVQILDNIDNQTYADGIAGSIYGQNPPLFEASQRPGEWNTYDIFFRRPIFGPDGSVKRKAALTVLLNGIVIQNNFELDGPTEHRKLPVYRPHADREPLMLQDHNERVRFRNIWIVPLED
jgi:hypothetical protein